MQFGTVTLNVITVFLILYIINSGSSSADTKEFMNVSKNYLGNNQRLAGENLNTNQGTFSDLQIIFCNANNNPCNGTNDLDYMSGDNGNNMIVGMNGNDNITSNGGDDEIWANEGKDIVGAGNGNDLLIGGDGDDVLYGEFNNDVILGGKGNDYLYGGPESWSDSDDIIAGGPGMDTIFGGDGNDKIYQNNEQPYSNSVKDGYKDRINCGSGNDEVWINVDDKDYAIYCEKIHKSTTMSKQP